MRSSLTKILHRLRGDSRGSTAVEFALVALPFFLMIAGMVETGYVAFKAAVMEGATREAARQVRTGVVQGAGDAGARFQQEFCPNLIGLFPSQDFYFDVRNFADFAAITLPAPVFDAAGIPTNVQFSPGGANTVVTVRVIHVHAFITPLIGSLMGGGDGTLPLISTTVMRTEPFE